MRSQLIITLFVIAAAFYQYFAGYRFRFIIIINRTIWQSDKKVVEVREIFPALRRCLLYIVIAVQQPFWAICSYCYFNFN